MARAAGVTVERLTLAAAELADEVGFEKVTVSALARRFAVKDASLYSHIRNVQDLRSRVAALALEELADEAASALAGRAGKDALVAFADAYRGYARRHPGRYAATQLELPTRRTPGTDKRSCAATGCPSPTRPTRCGCCTAPCTGT